MYFKKSVFAIIIATSLGHQAYAEETKQDNCGIDKELSNWIPQQSSSHKIKEKILPIGKDIEVGDVIYYVSTIETKKTYIANNSIQLKDKSPLNPDTKIEAGQTLDVIFELENTKTGETLDIVKAKGNLFTQKYIPVKEDGLMCAVDIGKGLDGRITTLGMPIIEQDTPLKPQTEETSQSKTTTYAITLNEITGPIAKIEISKLTDNNQVYKKIKTFDAIGGEISISGLGFKFKKTGGKLKLIHAKEPQNIKKWFSQASRSM